MFRPFLTELESRENPSVPYLDPIGVTAPPPVDPAPVAAAPAPAATPSDTIIGAAYVAAVTVVQSVDPLLANNSIYKVPLLP